MGNVLSEEKRQQVIALGRLGWSLRGIEKATVVRRETASGYLKAAGIAIRAPGSWGPETKANEVITDSDAAKPTNGVTTDPAADPDSKPAIEVTADFRITAASAFEEKQHSSSVCEPYRETIARELARGRNAMGVLQDLVDGYGFAGGYQSVKQFVRKLRGVRSPEARAIIETLPGEEAQVDYGSGPMVRDPQNGKCRRTRLFVMTLGYSRKSVRLLVFRSSAPAWSFLSPLPFADHASSHVQMGGEDRLA
jgi:hypothetical protein